MAEQIQIDLWASQILDAGERPGPAAWQKYGITDVDDQRKVAATYVMFRKWDEGKYPAGPDRSVTE